MSFDMDIDVPYDENAQFMEQLVLDAACNSKLKKTPEWKLMEKTNKSQYKTYYTYLLLETLKIFPSDTPLQKPGPTKLLMLEPPKETSQKPIQKPSQSNAEDECIYKRKCQISSLPIKLIKYSSPLISY